jgi:DNA-binding transcriptional ArsR family regulator
MNCDVEVRDRVDVGIAAHLFHGLSDPTRLAILLSLLDGERRVGDIVEVVGSSQPNVSNHLGCLKGCGLVTDRPGERRQVFYSIARPEVRDLLMAAERFLVDGGQAISLCANPLMGPRPRVRRG